MSKKVCLMDISRASGKQNVQESLFNGHFRAMRNTKCIKQKGWRLAPAFIFWNYSFTTLAACGPRFPSTISKETSWPSSRDL